MAPRLPVALLAEARTGSARQALVHHAEAALADYRERASKEGGIDDSVAVLEAYFAALDGRHDAARAAAAHVDPAGTTILRTFTWSSWASRPEGDHAAAEAVRTSMRRPGRPSIPRAIMLRWLDADARAGQARGHVFTPLHAGP